ncbi:jg1221 [Pararge aegeria aegeria]|uniref:Jg1221 protein n=1 Tax=Pararge aegeria aegeria TaxID=348720 RepID=A0A8S4R9Y7_9NEOP|nr:jg1221 [Pararge aegeria aegeria]
MRRALVVLCLLARVSVQMQAVQRYFVARKTRSNSTPVASGYAYSQVGNGPPTLESFHNGHFTKQNLNVVKNATDKLLDNGIASKGTSRESHPTSVNKLWPERGNASKKHKFSPSSLMKYDSIFRTDEEDLRTDFNNVYDIWPFFFHNLQEHDYNPKIIAVETEKAIDKRFAVPKPKTEKIIPVHETVNDTDDSENKAKSDIDTKHTKIATSDNPIMGNQPFFSYVLNDYFDKTNDDDPTTFKGLTWGKEFDHEMRLQDIDTVKRKRRLEENNPHSSSEESTNTYKGHNALRESLNNKGRDGYRESEASKKGNDKRHSYDGNYEYNGENYRGFKDFVDSFANKFGLEEHDREANYNRKNNADKGEKKKGFRKVYHKDEYQEHHDFFDNTNNNENLEENGASKVHIGASEGLLRSLAGAATGNDKSKLSNAENMEKKQYETNHEDKERYNGIERELDQYRDVAKYTALSNNADYVDRLMM